MIVLNDGDKILGNASIANKVDYTLYGMVGTTLTSLADGQLPVVSTTLYTASGIVVVTTIILVNTDDTSAYTVDLKAFSTGGVGRRIIPTSLSLAAKYSLHWSGDKITVMDSNGAIQQSYVAHDLGGAAHTADTLAHLNTLISDATLVDTDSITLKALFDAYSILAADTDNAPAAIALAASQLIGRKATGGIVALSKADLLTIINVTEGANVNVYADESEVNTGTEAAKSVSPDALAGSKIGSRIMYIKVLANDTALATGDGKAYVTIPIELNGMNLVLAHACVYTKSSSGLPAISLERSVDQGSNYTDMLSTGITIDENEFSSYVAATPPVIDGAQDDVATGYWIRVNVDTAGTGTKGLDVILTFQLP